MNWDVRLARHNALHFKSHLKLLRGCTAEKRNYAQGHRADSGNPKGTPHWSYSSRVAKQQKRTPYHQFMGLSTSPISLISSVQEQNRVISNKICHRQEKTQE